MVDTHSTYSTLWLSCLDIRYGCLALVVFAQACVVGVAMIIDIDIMMVMDMVVVMDSSGIS